MCLLIAADSFLPKRSRATGCVKQHLLRPQVTFVFSTLLCPAYDAWSGGTVHI